MLFSRFSRGCSSPRAGSETLGLRLVVISNALKIVVRAKTIKNLIGSRLEAISSRFGSDFAARASDSSTCCVFKDDPGLKPSF